MNIYKYKHGRPHTHARARARTHTPWKCSVTMLIRTTCRLDRSLAQGKRTAVWISTLPCSLPVPVVESAEARFLGLWFRIPHGGNGMDVCPLWLLCVVRQRFVQGADHPSRGVLPILVCLTQSLGNPQLDEGCRAMREKICSVLVKDYRRKGYKGPEGE